MLGHFIDSLSDLLLQIGEITTLKGVVTGQNLEEYRSKRPNICLLVIEVSDEDLWCHV